MIFQHFQFLETIVDKGPIFIKPDGAEVRYSFAQLMIKSRQMQSKLQRQGFKKGQRLVLIIEDNEQFICTFLGAVMAGCIVVPLFPPFSKDQMAHYIKTITGILFIAEPTAIITIAVVKGKLSALSQTIPALEAIITLEELAKMPNERHLHVPLEPEDICLIQFTEGARSKPRGVVINHRTLAANADAMVGEALTLNSNADLGVCWLPLFHGMGLIGNLLAPLFAQIPMIYLPNRSFVKSPGIWLTAVSRFRATVTFTTNFGLELVIRRANAGMLNKIDLSCLRVLGCGGEPLNPILLSRFQSCFKPAGLTDKCLLPCYGMSESTLAISFHEAYRPLKHIFMDRQQLERKLCFVRPASETLPQQSQQPDLAQFLSCGQAFKGHEILIKSAAGEQLSDNQVGEIVVQGPSVAQGYFNDPAATRLNFRADGLYTGDRGFIRRGELYVLGKIKDIIFCKDRQHCPQEIEWQAEQVVGVRKGSVAAFSLINDPIGHIFLLAESKQLARGAEIAAKIKANCLQILGIHLYQIMLVKSGVLPKTVSGKIQRNLVRKAYLEGQYVESQFECRSY